MRATASHSSSSDAARANVRRREPAIREELLLPRALLCGVQGGSAWPDGGNRLDRVDGVDRHVLELERHDVNLSGKRTQRVEILVLGDHLDIRHLSGRGVRLGRKGVDVVAHSPRRDREHPAELPAAKHAERRARRDYFRHGSFSWRTFWV